MDAMPALKEYNRTQVLKEQYLNAERRVDMERAYYFTQSFKSTEGEEIQLRRAKAFRHVLENTTPHIREGELIVGSLTKYIRGSGLYPEHAAQWLKEEMEELEKRDFSKCKVAKEDAEKLKEVIDYWADKSLQALARDYVREMLPMLEDQREAALVTPDMLPMVEGRIVVDYPKVLNKGIRGIIEEAQERLDLIRLKSYEDFKKFNFLKAVIIACEGVIQFAKRYAWYARGMAQRAKDPEIKRESTLISQMCHWVPENPARNFHEALQSFWFTHLVVHLESGSLGLSPGRFDQYMYPFYRKDIEEGRITREKALELLECLRIKFTEIERINSMNWEELASSNLYQNMTIGGITTNGEAASNELSELILEATKRMRTVQPTLSIRYNDKLPESLLLKAIDLVRTGIGMPAWFNDEVAIAHFLGVTGTTLEDARDWALAGCVQMGLSGNRNRQLAPGFYNCGKCMELALNDGKDPVTGKQISLHTGPAEEMKSFEDIVNAYKVHQAHAIEVLTNLQNILCNFHRERAPLIFESALINDCLGKGLNLDEGGARYNDSYIVCNAGLVNAANSLAAIKKVIFEKGKYSIKDLKDALAANFKGWEDLHQTLLKAPKFGNDEDYVDLMAKDLFAHAAEEITRHKNPLGVPYSASIHSITTHPVFGRACGATPDGRKAGEPLADGSLSPFLGTDTNGPTAVIKSASKIDSIPLMDTLLNMKFHPSALEGKEARKLLNLIKTYFDLGGWHIQFNVVDSKVLKEARKNPEKYRDLIIRVAGFSAYFVELSPRVQDEIIARTEYRAL